jgi:tetratricopeptide (TPR) repeat protein
MKSCATILLVLLSVLYSNAASLPYNDYWQRGNRHFAAQNYDSAAFYFGQLAAANPDAPEVYYNLGNAYYRLNNIGKAVLYYSRALQLKPAYAEAADNLELAQSRIKNRITQPQDIFFVTWWKTIASPANAGIWSVVALVLFVFLLLLIYFRRMRRPIAAQLVAGVAVLFAVSMALAYASSQAGIEHDAAVVMQEGVTFRAEKGEKSVSVPEGTIVTLRDSESGAWVKVSLPDGRTGAVQRNAIEKI